MKVTIGRMDWVLILPLVAGILMVGEIDPPRENAVAISQWTQGGLLIAITLVLSVIVAFGSAIDRRCTEEYIYQILANAALVAVATTMLVNLAWLIGVKTLDLPDMSAENMVGVTTLALVLSYYWFRFKGISR